ncbi:MAG: dienelactone hydrolase family protein, partial [Deltaproteobacteria bacterium]|nr:dienelactone hydrolase family protein [Deltaproteobacteria bacterium]
LAVAGCWFSGSGEKSPAPPTPISCPNGPAFRGSSLTSITYVKALISVARVLPGANSQRVGLIGVSRGASAALLVASTDGVQAVVSDSAPYIAGTRFDTAPLGLVQSLAAPVLMLHGTADQTVRVEVAREYEHALRQWNKPFEVHYYEGAPHAVTIYSGTRADARRRAIGFLTKHLASAGPSSKGS